MNYKRLLLAVLPYALLILIGEGYQIALWKFEIGITQVSLAVTLFLLVAFNKKRTVSPLATQIKFLIFIAIFYSILGLLKGNYIADIKEDLIGFIYILIIIAYLRTLTKEELLKFWNVIIIVSFVAIGKIIILNLFEIKVDWGGDWQARRDYLPGFFWSRTVLRGADIYFVFSAISIICLLIFKYKKSLGMYFLLVAFLFAVFISLSRSSYLAVLLCTVLMLFIAIRFKIIKFRSLIFSIFSICAILIIVISSFSKTFNLYELYLKRIETYDASGSSVTWRSDENNLVLNRAAESYFMGGGMGEYFHIYNSGSTKSDRRSLYTHNILSWIILKMGLFGLIALLLFLVYGLKDAYKIIKGEKYSEKEKMTVMMLLLSAIGLITISIFANKLFMISGAFFWGYYLTVMERVRLDINL